MSDKDIDELNILDISPENMREYRTLTIDFLLL